jgi:hypothetical protein
MVIGATVATDRVPNTFASVAETALVELQTSGTPHAAYAVVAPPIPRPATAIVDDTTAMMSLRRMLPLFPPW